jgi:class 3 adenylate cyclase
MTALPRGTVTFLFSDIEGSTRLLTELGPLYETILDDQRRLLTEAVEDAGGHIVDRSGDAMFAAFERAQAAVAAAIAAQRAVGEHEWPAGAELRLRMGLHSGEPSVTGEGFVGLSVHKAARICAAGHGGQVLLSSTTCELAQDGLPPDVVLFDLGEHHLKDFSKPERITQLVIGSLPAVLTPIRTVEAQPDETAFAGQEEEVAAASEPAFATDVSPGAAAETRSGRQLVDRLIGWREGRWSRRGQRSSMEAAGMHLYAASRIAPDDALRTQTARLGGAVSKLARAVDDADKLLGARDRKALARRLAESYAAPLSEHAVETAEVLVHQISALDALADRRHEFNLASGELEPRLRAIPDQIFKARLDHATPPELSEKVTDLLVRIELLEASLANACSSVVAPQQAMHGR